MFVYVASSYCYAYASNDAASSSSSSSAIYSASLSTSSSSDNYSSGGASSSSEEDNKANDKNNGENKNNNTNNSNNNGRSNSKTETVMGHLASATLAGILQMVVRTGLMGIVSVILSRYSVLVSVVCVVFVIALVCNVGDC